MSVVRCAMCRKYISKDTAIQRNLSSFCDEECFRDYRRKRSAPKPPKNPLPEDRRKEVLDLDHHMCCLCHATTRLHVHHIHYRSGGVDHSIENLITLCQEDHQLVHSDKKKSQPMLERLAIERKWRSVGIQEDEHTGI